MLDEHERVRWNGYLRRVELIRVFHLSSDVFEVSIFIEVQGANCLLESVPDRINGLGIGQ
jgi:hypothetical protein